MVRVTIQVKNQKVIIACSVGVKKEYWRSQSRRFKNSKGSYAKVIVCTPSKVPRWGCGQRYRYEKKRIVLTWGVFRGNDDTIFLFRVARWRFYLPISKRYPSSYLFTLPRSGFEITTQLLLLTTIFISGGSNRCKGVSQVRKGFESGSGGCRHRPRSPVL